LTHCSLGFEQKSLTHLLEVARNIGVFELAHFGYLAKQNKHKIPPIKLKRHKIKNIQNNNKFWSGLTRPWLELINHQTRGEIASAFHTRGGGFSSN
jgi:hypothetical protein